MGRIFGRWKTFLGTYGILLSLLCLFACSRQQGTVSEEFEYNAEGRLILRIQPDGSKIKYKYDKQGLPIEIDYPDGPVKFAYNVKGNRVWVESKKGKTEYRYDAFDRLVEVIFKYSPEKRIRYEYDPWNRISAIKLLDARNDSYQAKYEYNLRGNLISVDDGNERIEYSYFQDKGEVVRQLPNGIKTIFSYSPSGDLISLKHLDSSNGLLAAYRYEHNPPGKISRVFEETPKSEKITAFEWDRKGYLKKLTLPDGKTINYEYDAMGNRISMTDSKGKLHYQYDSYGRLIKAGDIRYEWTDNGNLAAQIEKESKTRFRYDGRNLPLVAKTPNKTIQYRWDGDGNMISRGVGKDMTYYLADPLAPPGFTLAEFDSAGSFKCSYLYGDSLLGKREANGRMKYFLEDGFNSIRLVADADGKIIGQKDYTPFGELINTNGDFGLDFRMMGERYLPETGKSFIGNRLYDPSNGLYISHRTEPGPAKRSDGFAAFRSVGPSAVNVTEPRCNQTKKSNRLGNQEYSFFWGIPLEKEISISNKPPQLWWFENIYKDVLGVAINDVGWRDAGYWLKLPLGFAGPVSEQGFRQMYGGPDFTWKDIENYSRSILTLWATYGGSSIGTSLGGPEVGALGGMIGKYSALALEGTVANLARFYGTRMDRPYWWWSPMKWIPQEEYLKNIEDQGKNQGKTRKKESVTLLGLLPEKQQRRDEYYLPPPICPPFCGDDDGGSGGGAVPLGNGFNDPIKPLEAKLGGIKLDATAQMNGNLGDIKGVVYDPEKQVLVLLSDEKISLTSTVKPEDFAVALVSVFGSDRMAPQDPQFSLDPADPKDPRGKWLKAVYIPERVIGGTDFGKTLFEADWLLKQYSFGVTVDTDGKIHERKSSVPGLKSIADLSFEEKGPKQGNERWNRFWIVSEEMKLKQSGKSISFESAKMRVKTKKQVPDKTSPSGLKDVDSKDDLVAMAFAKKFSEKYDEIAKESPEFERVRQLAKAIAIAKWIKKEGIPFDGRWVNEHANKRVDTIGQVTALSKPWERREQTPFQRGGQSGILTRIHKIHLFGGVDLTVKPIYESADRTSQDLQKAVTSKLREKGIEPAFEVKLGGQSYTAAILPVTPNGQALWKNTSFVTVGRTRYQFGTQGLVVKSTDQSGNMTEYTWAANRRLDAFNTSTRNGWVISGKKKDGHSELTITNPLKNTFLYRYNPSGRLNEMTVNGQRYAAVDYRGGEVAIQYENFTEKIKFDHQGRLSRYETQSIRKDTRRASPQGLDIAYDKNSNITRIESPDTGPVKLTYSGKKIESLSSGRDRVDCSYDAGGNRLRQVNTTWGEKIRYDYEGDQLFGLTYQNGSYDKTMTLKKGLPVKETDSAGGSREYQYTPKGLLERVVDSTNSSVNYRYDSQDRLSELYFPDGSRTHFLYEWKSSKNTEGRVLKKVKVSYTAPGISSSPLSKVLEPGKAREAVNEVLAKRSDDIKEANWNLKNGLILDLYTEAKEVVHGNIADPTGNIHQMGAQTGKELRTLMNITAKTKGKLGKEILDRWERLYNSELAPFAKATPFTCPDGKTVRLKPALIIKSNEVDYQFANLEKVPVLAENFAIFIPSKNQEKGSASEISASDLVNRINSIPKLSLTNAAFFVRLPEMSKSELNKWNIEVGKLESLVGKDNVLVDPSKEEFSNMLRNKGKDIIAIEFTHTDKGILLKNGERITSRDIQAGGDLSHIKYLVSGLGTCNLLHLEDGQFASSLRQKGVGVINGSYKEVSSKVALEKLKELINILRNVREYDLYPYQLIDIIDQRLGISGEGTINLGKRDLWIDRFVG